MINPWAKNSSSKNFPKVFDENFVAPADLRVNV